MEDKGWRDAQAEAEIRCAAKDAHVHAQDEGLYEKGKIFSWAVCRFLDEDEEKTNINSNRVGNITSLTYGIFTKDISPPDCGWITFPDEGTTQFANDQVTLEVGYYETVKGVTHRFYTLRGSSNGDVNGRYVNCGFHCGAPMYRNIRSWIIIRQALGEIAEIGIQADSTYKLTDGSSITRQFYNAAGKV